MFKSLCVENLWDAFGNGKHRRYIAIPDVCSSLNDRVTEALPAFHALTGSDVTSFFAGTSKKSAYEKWQQDPNLTNVLLKLMETPEDLNNEDVSVNERYVISLYSAICPHSEVN